MITPINTWSVRNVLGFEHRTDIYQVDIDIVHALKNTFAQASTYNMVISEILTIV